MECKSKLLSCNRDVLTELIDTLWNVNEDWDFTVKGLSRINRYIMECKWQRNTSGFQSHRELIDTLWNVNDLVDDLVIVAKSN